MNLLEAIEKRRSIRKFKDKNIGIGDIYEVIDAALYAPSAGKIDIIYFIIVTEQYLKNEIAKYSDQDWIADASVIVVVCSNDKQLERMYQERANLYARQQAGAVIQNLLLRVEDLGLGACWVGSFLDGSIKKLLKIPEHITVEALVPIGYPAEKPKIPKKPSLENSVFWGEWGQRKKPTKFKDPPTW